ncbi:GntR family transcriptional regulator [Brachybacterium huguangmaarense]|uniref:GntR family transcriptional regulator n=1 Tax=Brachybacterium huguangmaarense TaxID=1652028 RepID=A0ABY6G5E8_9MICO|nr:GntR family transcriptional regulator [Brachybacterium huguangmaarense]UYG17869.1 GntR family transcriptional regulator [Brachybacterium huguangmaarense]
MSSTSATVSAPDRVYQHLKNRILTGALPGGEMTSESEIAAALGVSRTPVREALMRLQAESLVRIHPKRGVLIAPIAPGEADDVFDARMLVEAHAARHVAALPSGRRDVTLGRLRDLLDAQESAIADGDLEVYARRDADFHLTVISAGGNQLLAGFAHSLRERQQRLVAGGLARDTAHAARFAIGHRELLAQLEAGDADGYVDLLEAHLEMAREVLA